MQPAEVAIEVVLVINHGELSSAEMIQQNERSREEVERWNTTHQRAGWSFKLFWKPDLPRKHAGVGLARKIGLDYAADWSLKHHLPRTILACMDADTTVAPNYFSALLEGFQAHPKMEACSIAYAHPLEGKEHLDPVYEAIIQYELHLRYFLEAKKWTGFPFAIETIGSAMAVTAREYQKQGGMNRRKAGEDFYFLQKFIEAEKCFELNTTTVFPSPRLSDRVPFGTGKAISQLVNEEELILQTYHPSSFIELKDFFQRVLALEYVNKKELLYVKKHSSSVVVGFLDQQGFDQTIEEILSHTATTKAFEKRFFRWFNAFKVMKYVHFARTEAYPDIPVEEAVNWLISIIWEQNSLEWSAKEKLLFLRDSQKGG